MYRMFRECLMRSSDYDPVNGQLVLPVADEGGLDLIAAEQTKRNSRAVVL